MKTQNSGSAKSKEQSDQITIKTTSNNSAALAFPLAQLHKRKHQHKRNLQRHLNIQNQQQIRQTNTS
jgi:hypothetical protein